jgi:hypothetical protein
VSEDDEVKYVRESEDIALLLLLKGRARAIRIIRIGFLRFQRFSLSIPRGEKFRIQHPFGRNKHALGAYGAMCPTVVVNLLQAFHDGAQSPHGILHQYVVPLNQECIQWQPLIIPCGECVETRHETIAEG